MRTPLISAARRSVINPPHVTFHSLQQNGFKIHVCGLLFDKEIMVADTNFEILLLLTAWFLQVISTHSPLLPPAHSTLRKRPRTLERTISFVRHKTYSRTGSYLSDLSRSAQKHSNSNARACLVNKRGNMSGTRGDVVSQSLPKYYRDVNTTKEEDYWDYEKLSVNWGFQDDYEVLLAYIFKNLNIKLDVDTFMGRALPNGTAVPTVGMIMCCADQFANAPVWMPWWAFAVAWRIALTAWLLIWVWCSPPKRACCAGSAVYIGSTAYFRNNGKCKSGQCDKAHGFCARYYEHFGNAFIKAPWQEAFDALGSLDESEVGLTARKTTTEESNALASIFKQLWAFCQSRAPPLLGRDFSEEGIQPLAGLW